jgi:hypothetical protein
MKKKKPAKQKVSKKSDKQRLAAGAEEIRKAEKHVKAEATRVKRLKRQFEPVATPPEPVVIPESTRDIKEILKDHVTVLPGSIGLKINNATPIEESLRVLDWTTTLSKHVGFMIGDVIIHGESKWGQKYTAALNQTGRKQATLEHYVSVARRIPPENRQASLSFEHHREIAKLGAGSKVEEVLKEEGAKAEKGLAITRKDLRYKIQKLTPRKKKKEAKPSKGKGKGKGKKAKSEPPPYEPTPEQQSILDELEQNLGVINDTIKSTVVVLPNIHGEDNKSNLLHLLCALDNKEKQRWLKLLEPVFYLYNTVERLTGY